MSADDRLEIMELVARYAYAWDAKDAAAYSGCFTEDAEFEVYTRGHDAPAISERSRDAIESWARRSHSGEIEGMRAPDPRERRWQCRPYGQFCIVPGTSAPRSTSSRSMTITVLPFDFTSHQNATASSSFQALLSSRSRPVHHTSRKRRASVSLGHSARSGRSASVSAIHSSSVIAARAPGVAALRREEIETVDGAGSKSAELDFEAAARTLVVCRVRRRAALRGWGHVVRGFRIGTIRNLSPSCSHAPVRYRGRLRRFPRMPDDSDILAAFQRLISRRPSR